VKMETKKAVQKTGSSEPETKPQVPSPSRRKFMGKAGGLGAVAVASSLLPLEPLLGGKGSRADASVVPYKAQSRLEASRQYRRAMAENEFIDRGVLPDNGDATRFTDFSGSWSKVLPHPDLGIVNPAAWLSLKHALQTGRFEDFENIIVGNPDGTGFTSTLNGPQGALAFDLEGLDSHATTIPPAPSVASAQTAAELVEHYWAALMRDVQFNQYSTSSLAAQACADLNNMSYIRGNQNNEYPYPVTPQNLFRGQVYPGDGNVVGPYLSQFLVQPTMLGVQPLSQMYQRFLSVGEGGADYMTTVSDYLAVESGQVPTQSLAFDRTYRHARMGRDMSAYTHVDVLHQAYFVALLVMCDIHVPLNPGNPYIGSRTEHGFVTFGSVFADPDAAGTVPEMATRALKAAWFHKWIVNLRQRPEEVGALVQARLTNQQPMPQAAAALHHDVLNSAVLPIIYSQYNNYLLPQAFPEGAPAHPCYPTGHGTVGGACITALKFFLDGTQKLRPILQAVGSDIYVPSQDGLTLEVYTGSDRDEITVNGELAKLGWNISIGHGIHAGIHFRSSSLYSLLLGEAVALSCLKDRAKGYNEPFTINITKFDGTTATISNQ